MATLAMAAFGGTRQIGQAARAIPRFFQLCVQLRSYSLSTTFKVRDDK
jgi:hypothetical protein